MKFCLSIAFVLLSLILSAQCETYEYDNIFDASWLSCEVAEHPALDSAQHWIQYDLGFIRHLGPTHFWNYNVEFHTHLGAKEIALYTSIDNITWSLSALDTLEEATGLHNYKGQSGPNLSLISSQYILIAITNTQGDSCAGLSEVQFEFIDNQCESLDLSMELTQSICTISETATLNLSAIGGSGVYNYFWSNGHDSSYIENLVPGDYQVLVIDEFNCSKTFNIDFNKTSTDKLIFDFNNIKSGNYLNDTIHSSGSIIPASDVNFLFEDETVLEKEFILYKGGELCITKLNCESDSAQPQISLKNLSYQLPFDVHSEYIGKGNDTGILINASDENNQNIGVNSINGIGSLDESTAARFLSQATLGYSSTMINSVSELGIEEWLEQQFENENESYFNHLENIMRFNQPNTNYWLNFHRTWWHNNLTGQEYLRESVAFALSQIFVISSKSFLLNYGDGMTAYYDMLLENSFGNYRDLLNDVTMSPMMGFYLSHLNNSKSDLTLNRFPDENYAREILQLFSIGLYELNIDGSRKTNSLGQDIPTYTNDDIIEFAKIFTGLGFSGRDFGTPANQQRLPYTLPMVMNDDYHEPGVKHLLYGHSIPNGQTGVKDIHDALDNIFNHPNVGPFISTRLIQRMVKSEPSPEYIQRVAEIFNDNGKGVRGDLKAVVKAILLDNEARNCDYLQDAKHGMLREPMSRIIHLLKAFNISNQTNTIYALGSNIESLTHQAPLRAPSVFNFYQSDHSAPGVLSDSMTRSPEFAILDSYSSIGYVNLVDSISSNIGVLDVEEGTATLDFSEELTVASNANTLIDLLDKKLTYGHLSDRTRNIMIQSINQVGADPVDRVRMAVYIIANSPDFTILR